MNSELFVLDNGLKVFFVNDNNKHTTYINLIVKYGGIDNTFYKNKKKYKINDGMAHFIEHLVLESSCFGDLMENFGKLGIASNGLTGLEKTQFYIDTVDHIYDGLKVLIKGIHNPVINQEVIDNIKKPIIEEKKRSLDNKFSNLYNETFSNLIDNKTFKSVLGEINYLNNIKEKDILTCFKTFYRPENEIIVIGGRFDKNKVLEVIKKTYDELSFENDIVKKINNHKDTVKKKEAIVKTNTGTGRVAIAFKLDSVNLTPYEKLKLDSYIFCFLRSNFGIMSKLNKKMIEEKITTDGIQYSNGIVEGYHYIIIEANTDNQDIFINNILDYFKDKKFIFDKSLYELDKKSAIINLISRKDSIYNMVDPFIENIISYGYEELDTIEFINKLSFKEFKDIITNLNFSNYTITKLINK